MKMRNSENEKQRGLGRVELCGNRQKTSMAAQNLPEIALAVRDRSECPQGTSRLQLEGVFLPQFKLDADGNPSRTGVFFNHAEDNHPLAEFVLSYSNQFSNVSDSVRVQDSELSRSGSTGQTAPGT